MKYFVLSACITIAFFFSASEKAFSITDQEQQVDTTSNESDETSPYAQGLTAGRAKSLVGGVLGLISLIIGWRVKARVASSHSARSWATTAFVLGLVAISSQRCASGQC